MLTNAGGGYSRRQQLALTRWREDITSDAWGSFVFVRDLDTGDVWSTTHQPSGREAEEYEATFSLDRAVWRRVDSGLETRTEVVVSPEDDAELRRVSITNNSHRARSLDLTSYAEVVLAPAAADLAHPAFSNLFIETTAVPGMGRAALHAPAAVRHRPRLPGPRAQRPRPHRRRHRVRNRPRAVHRTRPDARQPRGAQRRRTALEYDRRRARSDRQPAPVDSPPARRHGAPVVHDRRLPTARPAPGA